MACIYIRIKNKSVKSEANINFVYVKKENKNVPR